MVKTYLDGVAIGNYRGIGEVQRIGPFSEVNFFIGPNNAGKSIVLNFIHGWLPFSAGERPTKLDHQSPEAYRGVNAGSFLAGVGVFVDNFLEASTTEGGGIYSDFSRGRSNPAKAAVEKMVVDQHVWFAEGGRGERTALFQAPIEVFKELASGHDWNFLWQRLTQKGAGNLDRHWIPESLVAIQKSVSLSYPAIKLIPAKRQLGPKDETFDDQSGKGLIDELARLQSPGHNEQEKRKLFKRINGFVQEVTGKPKAEIEVPHDRKHLLVHMDNKVLPLENLGTGIHEVILIAAFCTIHTEQIICIEEPEIHLHPTLQRKLIRYLQDNTDNQYFIATHSAAFIDTPGASVFRVWNDGVQSYVEPALLKDDKWQICEDLGYRASDILQANMVIWVEGPSDRIYLNHWIEAIDPDLIEGTHYTIMFYGGGLVSHLSAESEGDPLGELIDLRSLNKNMAIVMDSDRDSDGAVLKSAAQRLIDEVTDERGMVWITMGREIENYVDYDDLQEVLKELHPRVYGEPDSRGTYDHAFYFKREGSGEVHKDANKVGAARKICEQDAKLDVLDLRERVTELVALIRRANDSGDAQKQP